MPSTQPSPVSFRPHRSRSYSGRSSQPNTLTLRLLKQARQLIEYGEKIWRELSPLKKIAVVILGIIGAILGLLSLIYHAAILHTITKFAKGWRSIPAGWLILWAITYTVSFPPLIGYSTCVGLGGFVFGFPNGWFIVASSSTLGALSAFLLCRSYLHNFVMRLTAKEPRFQALSLVLKHDGIKLLFMIRLCPLPFSLTNGMLASVPTVTPTAFLLATALASPKLLLHVWVGAQMAMLAESGEKTPLKTRIVSYLGIVIGTIAGAGTGYWIWVRTKKRADELAALEGLEDGRPSRGADDDDSDEQRRQLFNDSGRSSYEDEPWDDDTLRETSDDISLHEADHLDRVDRDEVELGKSVIEAYETHEEPK